MIGLLIRSVGVVDSSIQKIDEHGAQLP